MDPAAWDDGDLNQDEELEFQEPMWAGRDGLIFLIDASKPMFVEDESGSSPFKINLQCCRSTMLNKIVSSERDLMGVVLFGTDKTTNKLDVPHIYVLQDLQQPGADKIKQLETILNRPKFDDFENKYGHSNDFAISDALWLCQQIFADSPLKLSSKKILLFTNTDNPHGGSTQQQHRARRKAADLCQVGIDVELLHMGRDFDPSHFYKELIQTIKGEDSDDWRLPNPSTRFEELSARLYRKDHKKRSVGRIPFLLGGEIKFGVAIYNLVRQTTVPKKASLDKNTNEPVKSTIKKFHADTGEVLLSTELNKYQEFGFKKITLTLEETRNLRKMMDPCLKLLGFKPASKVKIHHHVTPSSFIYPDEGLVEGSRKLFAALLDRCVAKKVVPICIYMPRSNSTPSLVALLPQQECLDDANVQLLPPGFHVVNLPYAEDIRMLNIDSSIKGNPEQIESAKAVVKKLRFGYSPYKFDNPKLQTHWSNIEALAMDYNEPKEVPDLTVPDHEYMANKLGSLAKDFLDHVYVAGYYPGDKPKASGGRKRASNVVDNDNPKRTPKAAEDTSDMKALALGGKVEKLKVDQLKAYLQENGVKVTGLKKADLVSKVYQQLGIDEPN
ncbi:X-ray repair cross-complementing protein 6 [Periplaneta americana]|uniref:X-ray repair cross-complementing protein 6 n=1 Tax=Periplaneta americana TaxID=6978 RepID=UPI0037E7A57D